MRTSLTLGALLVLAAGSTRAQGWNNRMTSIDEYLYEESYEIVLARSAAPEHVAAEATVLVLERDGYVERHAGSNGFTCLVERSWSSPIGPHIDFFNPKLRAPICCNAEAARTVLIEYLRRT